MKSVESKKTNKENYYVDPDVMWRELESYYVVGGKVNNRLGQMLADIATKVGYMTKFINYSYKEEMSGDAQLKMVKAVEDMNFTLWNTVRCTDVQIEGGREYVYLWKVDRTDSDVVGDYDVKKYYLKEWDTTETNDFIEKKVARKLNKRELAKLALEKVNIKDPWVNLPADHPIQKKRALIDYKYKEYEIGSGVGMKITFKNNPFAYFTKIAYHAYVNRIKKEKKVEEVLHAYQEKVYEDAYASGNGWEHVKRQRGDEDEEAWFIDDSESDDFYDEAKEKEAEEEEEVALD